MTRGISSSLQTEVDSKNVRLVWFVKIEFASGTVYIHDGIGTINWNSQDWLGIGDFGAISAVSESANLSPYEITLTLSGMDADVVSDTDFANEVLTTNFFMRPVTIYIGAFDIDNGGLVSDPDEVWYGYTDTADLSLGGQNAVVLHCENEMVMFSRSNGASFSDAHHQSEVQSGDLFFEFLTDVLDARSVKWAGYPTSVSHNRSPSITDPRVLDVWNQQQTNQE